ncbi:MAG: hypothetical protein ACOCPW_06645 [Marinilabiliaceae bacterium]
MDDQRGGIAGLEGGQIVYIFDIQLSVVLLKITGMMAIGDGRNWKTAR